MREKFKWSILDRRALVSRVAYPAHNALRDQIADKKAVVAPPRETIHDDAIDLASHSRTTCHDRVRRQVLTIAAGAAGHRCQARQRSSAHRRPCRRPRRRKDREVKYQDTPKGEQRRGNCVQFEAPSTCKTVDGTVAAQGWCWCT